MTPEKGGLSPPTLNINQWYEIAPHSVAEFLTSATDQYCANHFNPIRSAAVLEGPIVHIRTC